MKTKQLIGWGAAFFLGAAMGLASCQEQQEAGAGTQEGGQEPAVVVLDTAALVARGVEITDSAFRVLSGELKAAMGRGGVPVAVPFCKTMAYPLTGKVADDYQVRLRRTALRTRNPQNAASEGEVQRMEAWEQQIAAGNMPTPAVENRDNGLVEFYRPIMTKELCTRCHGDVSQDIGAEAYTLIQDLYPEDQATGFAEGDLRGMWVVSMAARPAEKPE